jgi:hypothetical protein
MDRAKLPRQNTFAGLSLILDRAPSGATKRRLDQRTGKRPECALSAAGRRR